jgi:hypothetical protein
MKPVFYCLFRLENHKVKVSFYLKIYHKLMIGNKHLNNVNHILFNDILQTLFWLEGKSLIWEYMFFVFHINLLSFIWIALDLQGSLMLNMICQIWKIYKVILLMLLFKNNQIIMTKKGEENGCWINFDYI